jgi:WD40 repeat protein
MEPFAQLFIVTAMCLHNAQFYLESICSCVVDFRTISRAGQVKCIGSSRYTFLGDAEYPSEAFISAFEISPKTGELLVCGLYESSIQIWNKPFNHRIAVLPFRIGKSASDMRFPGSNLGAMDVVTTPDSKYACVQRTDNVIQMLDLSSGSCLWEIDSNRTASGRNTVRLAISPDGTRLAGIGSISGVCIWETRSGRLLSELGKQSAGSRVMFHTDGEGLACLGADTISMWDTAKCSMRWQAKLPEGDTFTCFAFDQLRKAIAATTTKGCICWFNNTDGNLIKRFVSNQGSLKYIAFRLDAEQLGTTDSNNTVTIREATTLAIINQFSGLRSCPTKIKFTPAGEEIVAAFSDQICTAQIAARGRRFVMRQRRPGIDSVSFSHNSQLLLAGSSSSISIWETVTGKQLRTIAGSDKYMLSIRGRFAASDKQGRITMHSVNDAKQKDGMNFSGSLGIAAICIDRACDKLYATSRSGKVRGWALASSKLILEYECKDWPKNIKYICPSSQGTLLFVLEVLGRDAKAGQVARRRQSPDVYKERLRVFDLSKNAWLDSTFQSPFNIRFVCPLSDDRTVALEIEGGKVAFNEAVFWNFCENVVTKKTNLSIALISAFAASGDSRYVAVGSGASVVIYETLSGEQIWEYAKHDSPVTCLSFSDNSYLVASGSKDSVTVVFARIRKNRQSVLVLGKQKLENLYKDLFGPSRRANESLVLLAEGGDTTALFLSDKIHPVLQNERRRIPGLILSLKSSKWSERDFAARELERLGGLSVAALLNASNDEDWETKKRAAIILSRIRESSPEKMGESRVVEALEYIGTENAIDRLFVIGSGDNLADISIQARAAFVRLTGIGAWTGKRN